MVHSISDSYRKFGAAAPSQTGVITRRKKWGRLSPPSKSRVNMGRQVTKLTWPQVTNIKNPRYTSCTNYWIHQVLKVWKHWVQNCGSGRMPNIVPPRPCAGDHPNVPRSVWGMYTYRYVHVSKISVTPDLLYVNSECPRPVDAPVVADGLTTQVERASRARGHLPLTYIQTGVTRILEAIVHVWGISREEEREVGFAFLPYMGTLRGTASQGHGPATYSVAIRAPHQRPRYSRLGYPDSRLSRHPGTLPAAAARRSRPGLATFRSPTTSTNQLRHGAAQTESEKRWQGYCQCLCHESVRVSSI